MLIFLTGAVASGTFLYLYTVAATEMNNLAKIVCAWVSCAPFCFRNYSFWNGNDNWNDMWNKE